MSENRDRPPKRQKISNRRTPDERLLEEAGANIYQFPEGRQLRRRVVPVAEPVQSSSSLETVSSTSTVADSSRRRVSQASPANSADECGSVEQSPRRARKLPARVAGCDDEAGPSGVRRTARPTRGRKKVHAAPSAETIEPTPSEETVEPTPSEEAQDRTPSEETLDADPQADTSRFDMSQAGPSWAGTSSGATSRPQYISMDQFRTAMKQLEAENRRQNNRVVHYFKGKITNLSNKITALEAVRAINVVPEDLIFLRDRPEKVARAIRRMDLRLWLPPPIVLRRFRRMLMIADRVQRVHQAVMEEVYLALDPALQYNLRLNDPHYIGPERHQFLLIVSGLVNAFLSGVRSYNEWRKELHNVNRNRTELGNSANRGRVSCLLHNGSFAFFSERCRKLKKRTPTWLSTRPPRGTEQCHLTYHPDNTEDPDGPPFLDDTDAEYECSSDEEDAVGSGGSQVEVGDDGQVDPVEPVILEESDSD